jgi:transposase
MQGKRINQPRFIQTMNIEMLVPQNYILRYIDKAVDLSFIRERTEKLYEDGVGRPSIPPELVLRLFLLQYLFDLSDRALCNEVAMHAGFRWFCRLNFDDPIPDRTTLVKLRQLWSKTGVFADVMQRIVQQCVDAGLVSGSAIAVDGTQVTANAATNSLVAMTPAVSLAEWLKQRESTPAEDVRDEEPPEDPGVGQDGGSSSEPTASKAPERKAGDENFHGVKFSNQTHRSATDPDARLARKGRNQEAKLRYLVHNAVDLKAGVILATMATQAFGTAEREAALALLDEFLTLLPTARRWRRYVADAGYTAGWYLAEVLKRGALPVVPLTSPELEPIPTWERKTFNLDQQRARHEAVDAAIARNTVRQQLSSKVRRQMARARTKVEHSFAEAKMCHGLGRARGRGLLAVHTQALLTAIAQNAKRLAANWRRKAAKAGPTPVFVSLVASVWSQLGFQSRWGVENPCPSFT